MTERLEAEDLLVLLAESTAPFTRVRDASVLYVAAARPESTIVNERTFKTLPGRTAALLHAIIRWEPLEMWNASLGWRAVRATVEINGGTLVMSSLDRMILANEIMDGRVDDVMAVAKRLAPFLREG